MFVDVDGGGVGRETGSEINVRTEAGDEERRGWDGERHGRGQTSVENKCREGRRAEDSRELRWERNGSTNMEKLGKQQNAMNWG